MKKILLSIIIIFSIIISLAQESRHPTSTLIQGNFVLGGKVTHKTMVYRSGINLDFAVLKRIKPQLQVGAGSGVVILEDEIFIPFYAIIKTNFKEILPSYYLTFKIGYSYGNNYKVNSYTYYNYSGGLIIEPGFGYQFQLTETTKFNAGIKAISQLGILNYKSDVYPEDLYKERLRFLLVGLNFGFEF